MSFRRPRLGNRIARKTIRKAAHLAARHVVEELEPRQLLSSPFTITEFMADNTRTLADEDGQYGDWVEIHNSAGTAQSLSGFHLTDSSSDLAKWTFPAISVPANGNIVVFADGKNRTNPAGTLHANFSLEASGEYLALTEPDGVTKDSEYNFGQQQTDISYGIDPNGGAQRFFAAPTPGAANQRAEVVINEIHYWPDVKTQLVEFIELYNPGSAPVDLSGASFTSGVSYTFPANSILQPGKYMVITQNQAQFQAKFQAVAYGQFTGSLSNEGETITLRNSSGGKLDEVDYGAGFPWPSVGATPGYSIQLINPDFDNSIGGNWRSGAPSVLSAGLPNATIFSDHSTWDYRKGTSEASDPTSAWKQINFAEDASWFQNKPGPVGYDNSLAMGSNLSDMNGNYVSVFMRKTFTITDPSQISSLRLEALYDDGFNVWINGVHVVRSPEMAHDDPAYNISVSQDNPNSSARENNNYITFNIANASSFLVAGTNVIAVHFHNTLLSNSSDAFFDARLTAIPTANVNAGAQNITFANNAPPLMRHVDNSPLQPTSNQPVTITSTVTDTDGVKSVVLQYQVVDPGNYIAIEDAAYQNPANWVSVNMHDDGLNGDAIAGDGNYTAVLPASVQVNRRLVRYRITSTDNLNNSLTAPYADDTVPNFAYYVYDGVPSYSAALQPGAAGANGQVQTFSSSTLTSLPYIQLLTKKIDHDNAQHIPGATQGAYSGSGYLWSGTLVFNGVVYDNIHYRARGGVWRYAMGKNMWKFDFQPGHDFQMYDVNGQPLPTKWKKLNLGADIQQGDIGDRGEQGMFETLSFQMFNLAGVPAEKTVPITFRIVENASPTGPTQYDSDFQGLYLALEQPDGRFLDSHNLPDGNFYKMEGGTGPGGGTLNNQGPTQPTDNSDLVAFVNTLSSNPSDQWIRDNIDLQEVYSYKAVVEMIHHWDIGFSKNYYFYHNPDTNKWDVIPWDTDLTWYVDYEPGGGDGTPFDAILNRAPFQTEYRNRVREIQDLLYSTGEVGKMADAYAALINPSGQGPTLAQADAAMWDYNPIETSSFVNSSKAGVGRFYAKSQSTLDFQGMVNRLKSWQAGRESYITNTVLTATDEAAAPRTPTVTYTGPAGFALDQLTFSTSAFQAGNQGGSFAAMQWRIADVTTPNAANPSYEVNAAWDSGELTTFSSSVTIPSPVVVAGHLYRVRVRMKDSNGRWSHWSSPSQFTASAAQSATKDSIRITELDYNPASPPSGSAYKKDDFEFIELKNIGSSAVNLQNVQFTTGITFAFPDLLLNPGEICVVVDNLAAFLSRYPSPAIKIAGVYLGNLSNSGEEIVLKDPIGQVIQDFTYGTDSPWPTSPDGGGKSLMIKDPLGSLSSWNDPTAWTASRTDNGTPGADESTIPDSAVVTNEVLSNSGVDGDWIELHNTISSPIDISGWWLSDTSVTPLKYQIPANTIIPANGYYTFDQFTSFGSASAAISFALNALGDDVVITSANPAGIPTGYVQTVHFDGSDQGATLGRYVKATGGSDFVPLQSSTKNAPNSAPSIGPVVINELMYSPALTPSPGDEYIEIYNITNNPISLYDPANSANTWKLTNGVDFTFPTGSSLPAHAYALIVPIDPSTFRSKYNIPASVQIFGPYTGALNNAGETVTLSRPAAPLPDNSIPYVPIDSIKYSNIAPWPGDADGTGSSIGRLSPTAYGNEPSNWITEVSGGTPGLPTRDKNIPTVSLPVIDPLPKPTPLDSIPITFSEPVQGFDLSHLTLTRNGGPNLLGSSQLLTTSDNANYTLSHLTGLDFVQGNYVLTVIPDGITDMTGQGLAAGASTSWSMTASALVGGAGDDAWTISISGSSLDIWLNVPLTDPPSYTAALSDVSSLSFDGTNGNDSVAILGGSTSVATYYPAGAAGVLPTMTFNGLPLQFANVDALALGTAENHPLIDSLTVVTPNSSDALLIDSPGRDQALISGVSSGASLLPITLFNTSTLIVDMASHDAPGNTDTLSVGAIPAGVISQLQVIAGDGTNAVAINGANLQLETNSASGDGSNLAVIINSGSNVTFPSSQKLASLTINSAPVIAAASAQPALKLGSLKITGSGTLDTVNSDLILTYTDTSPYSTILQYVQSGKLLASAANDTSFSSFPRTLATWDNNETRLPAFDGADLPDFNQVLVKYTYFGDANLDGQVTPSDYAMVDGNIGLGHSWPSGDLNGDGVVNPIDYAQIDGNIGAGTGGDAGPQLTVLQSDMQPEAAIAPATKAAVKKTKRHLKKRSHRPHHHAPKHVKD